MSRIYRFHHLKFKALYCFLPCLYFNVFGSETMYFQFMQHSSWRIPTLVFSFQSMSHYYLQSLNQRKERRISTIMGK